MVQINFARREINCKIVYYGPGLSGKTTNLEKVHEQAPRDRCGKLTSIATEGDRTLFFDFMPLSLGKVAGMDTKFQLYTVPGQTFYESTRRLVLQGADGVVFVADSQKDKLDENIESFENLRRNLKENGLNMEEMPIVIQYNKRDVPGAVSVETLNRTINNGGWPHFEAVAVEGRGTMQTLKAVSELVLETLNARHQKTSRRTGAAASDTQPPRAVRPDRAAEREGELVAASTPARPARAAMSGAQPAPAHTGKPGRAWNAGQPAQPRHAVRPARPVTTFVAATRGNAMPVNREEKKGNRIWVAAAVTIGAAAAVVGLLLFLK